MDATRTPPLEAVLLADRSRKRLLELASEECRRALAADRAVIWILEPGLTMLVAEPADAEPIVLSLSEPELEQLFSGTAVVSAQTKNAVARRLIETSFGPKARGGTLLPLHVASRRVGIAAVMGAAVSLPADELPDETQDLVEQLGTQLLNYDVLRRAHHLEALLQTTNEVAAHPQLETVLKTVVERARKMLNAPISYIMLHDSARSEIDMSTAAGVSSQGFSQIRLRTGAGLGGKTLEQRRPFYTSDYLNDDRYEHDSDVDQEVRRSGIKSILGVPVFTQDEFVAVLYVADRAVRTFPAADVDVLASLGRHVALAIENARLYERNTRALTEIQRTNAFMNVQNERLRRADEAQRQLTEVMLEHGGLTEITQHTARLLDSAVVVLDQHYQPIARAGEPADAFGVSTFADGLPASLWRSPEFAQLIHSLNAGDAAVLPAAGRARPHDRLVVPVVASAEILGSMWVEVEPSALDESRTITEQAARVIALELLREQSVAEVERRIHRELVDDLLAETPPAWDAIQRRAANSGVDLTESVRLCVIASRDSRATPRASSPQPPLVSEIPGGMLAAAYLGYEVILLEDWSPQHRAALTHALKQRGRDTHAVVCKLSRAAGENHTNFIVACKVLELLDSGITDTVLDLEEWRVLALLFGSADTAMVRSFVESALSPVRRQDPSERLDLVHTLEAYLFSGASPSRTASAMHVHVNTIYYRLDRIKAALGEDFASPRRALDLQIACLARRLL